MIHCDVCPFAKDKYPDRVDEDGYHFQICGMSGNIVYTTPHKEKRLFGHGYIHHKVSTCGLFETMEDAERKMNR